MRRALSGQSGTTIGLDYRGVTVLAAHEPVSILDLGIVAKIDLVEIRAPFQKAAAIVAVIATVLIALGTVLFFRVGNPIIRRIQESEEKFRQILESAADAILIVDERGCILIANSQVERLFGYARHELIGQPVELFLPEALREKHVAHRRDFNTHPRARPMGQDLQLVGRRKDGTLVPLEISLSPLYLDEKLMVTAIIRDITVRKQAENKLAKAKETAELANKSKSRFLTAASHDLRQPVQAIVSYTDLLAISNTDPALASTIQQLSNATLAMQVLLEGLLDISKLDTGTMRPEIRTFSISSLLSQIQELHQPTAMEKGITLKLVPCTAVVNSDPTLLRVILQNLISNAIKYTHRGKVIIGCRHRGDQLRIEVWDSGIGIPEDKQKSVFEEFYQIDNPGRDRNKGVGIGLTIVKRIATLLNHELYMHSVAGKGSSVAIQVPLVDNTREETQAAHPETTKSDNESTGSSILLIDDDEIVLDANYMLLEQLGYKVIPADSTEAAMQQIASASYPPDIIISDYRLAGDCVGTELVQQLRTKAGIQIPAIILTGDITVPDDKNYLPDNSLLMQKPARVEELIQAINQLLGNPVSSDE
jgi:PAS domain S-box-containing protein